MHVKLCQQASFSNAKTITKHKHQAELHILEQKDKQTERRRQSLKISLSISTEEIIPLFLCLAAKEDLLSLGEEEQTEHYTPIDENNWTSV
ncbi:hypothetical protein NPIL_41281 [Nephila pilipes]|uniref:Uncharacterized protein n=1 Tax=Nephila pilipes TaxID=299642 RepID=A0A8X6Q592_NEPPI|nr:hypothetical protein NPIL_41281 [Nephila pilipes]